MANMTLYIKNEEDVEMCREAGKMLVFYENKTLSEAFADFCEVVVIKYKKKSAK